MLIYWVPLVHRLSWGAAIKLLAGPSQFKVHLGKNLLPSSLSGCRQTSKHPLPTELVCASSQGCLIYSSWRHPKQAIQERMAVGTNTPGEWDGTQCGSHNLTTTRCHSVQPKLKGRELYKCRTSLGSTYVLFHFYSLKAVRMRLLSLRGIITCPRGRARIQIQMCMTPNLFTKLHYCTTFSDKNFSYGWGPWHSICFAINT